MKFFEKILKKITNISTIVVLTLVFYIIGAHVVDGFPHVINFTPIEFKLAVALTGMILGVLIGLKWRLIGGIISVLSFIAFAIVEQHLILGFVFNIFLLIGISNLILYWFTYRTK